MRNLAVLLLISCCVPSGCKKEDKAQVNSAKGAPTTSSGSSGQASVPTVAPGPRFLSDSAIQSWPGHVAVTRLGRVGFLAPDKTLYPLGTPRDQLIQRLGEPDKWTDYPDEGLKIHVREGKTSGYTFFVSGDYRDHVGKAFQPANVMTDCGIRSGSTLQEAVQAHGKPLEEYPAFGGRGAAYAWGSFVFDASDRLKIISISRPPPR